MLSKHLFNAARIANKNFAFAILPRNISTTSALSMRNAPLVPQLISEGEGEVYDHTKESLESFLNVNFGPDFPTINDDKNPARDLVNFPRLVRKDFPDQTRLGILPESWFDYFYPKTGVTGPYVFFGSFLTFLLSKEWLVFEHELLVGVQATIIIMIGVNMFGKENRYKICSKLDAHEKTWEDWQKGMIQFLKDFAQKEAELRDSPQHFKVLFDAKRENIKLQLEAEYRRRQMEAYNEVQRRLNYLVAKEEAEKQFQQKHMVDWIIENVSKSITPAQEKEALRTTLAELKKLSANTTL